MDYTHKYIIFAQIFNLIIMRKLILIISALALSFSLKAQSPTFSQSDIVINAGFGIGTSLYSGAYYKSTLPPLSVSVEYGLKDDFITSDLTLGIGGYFGIAGSKYEQSYWGGTYGFKYNYTVIGARAAVHYPFVDKLDTYAGLMLGYNIVSYKETGDWNSGLTTNAVGSSAAFSVYLGGRYYFSDKFAAMAEIGYGIAYLNLGVAFKL